MKRHLTLLALLAVLTVPACAQNGLAVAQLFDGRYKDRAGATEVLVKGRQLKAYDLTLFRSLTLRATDAETRRIEQLVRTDARHAADKETAARGGRLYYGFYRFPPADGRQRYLFYRNNALAGDASAGLTVVYLEGSATPDQLKQMFQK